MKHRILIILLAVMCAVASASGQSIRTLGYNTTNGQVVANTGTNVLTFTNAGVAFGGDMTISGQVIAGSGVSFSFEDADFAYGAPIVRVNLGFSTNLNTLWTATNSSNARSAVGLGATWLTNTNVTNFRTAIGLGAGNNVSFDTVSATEFSTDNGISGASLSADGILFSGNSAATTRTNLGLGGTNSWKLSSEILLSNNIFYFGTNAAWALEDNAMFLPISFENGSAGGTRTNLGLGATNDVVFNSISFSGSGTSRLTNDSFYFGTNLIFSIEDASFSVPVAFAGSNTAATTRTNLSLGATNNVAFRNITSDGNIVISNQSATNNGILFIYRTNSEPFLGLANLIASNNTTISNETLFRVGVAEATNQSAQFGFRSTNTNGSGVAVFSVFGYNALAMIGPSARSATNTNGIEADIYSINPTNKVATLIDTNTGATLMHRPVGFATNASTPSSTNTIVGWIEFFVGTNSVRVPYYQ